MHGVGRFGLAPASDDLLASPPQVFAASQQVTEPLLEAFSCSGASRHFIDEALPCGDSVSFA
jgi:hypothetical protein